MEPDNSLEEITQVPCQQGSVESDLGPGQLVSNVDGFEVIRELGRGGMGVVYLARDSQLDRFIALKTFHVEKGTDLAEMLNEEARAAGKLDHPGIVPVYQVNPASDPPYFSMAYINGEDLAHLLNRQVLNAKAAATLGIKIADALGHAHEAGVFHFDIKPGNILFDARGEPRITDFGLFALYGTNKLCGTAGTPQYMSPEQVLGKNEDLGGASDIYSTGAVLYAALVGRPPIVSTNQHDLLFKVVSERPRRLRSYGLRIPSALDAVVMKCLEKEPEKRYGSAAELRDDLQRCLDGKPVSARPPGAWENAAHYVQQHVLAASVSGSLVVAFLLCGLLLALSWVRDHAQLKADLINAEHIIQKRAADFSESLKRHADESVHLRVTMDVESETAQDLYDHGNLEMAARCAAKAILAASELQVPPLPTTEAIVREFYAQSESADHAETSELSSLEMAQLLVDDSQPD